MRRNAPRGLVAALALVILGGWVSPLQAERPANRQPLNEASRQGSAFLKKRQYAEAARSYEKALELAESLYGPDHVQTAVCVFNLGFACHQLGQHDRAELLYQRSLAIRERKLGDNHPLVANVLDKLGQLARDMGQPSRAEPLLQRSLKIREEKLGRDHLDVAVTLVTLGHLYWSMGQYAKAEPLFQRSLDIREAKLDRNHLAVAESLNGLANVCYSLAQYDRAEPLFQRSLEIREAKLEKGHRLIAQTRTNLATLYLDTGDYARAEALCQRSLEEQQSRAIPDARQLARALSGLGNVYRNMGQYAKAEPLYRQSLSLWEEKEGKEHPQVASSLNNLAMLYESMGHYARAEPLFQRSLQIREEKQGKDHPDVASSLNSLGLLYLAMGQYPRAEALFQRSLQIREEKLGKDHPIVAVSLNNLALTYKSRGQYARAEPLFQRSLEIREKLGKDHFGVAACLQNLGSLYLARDRYDRAEAALQRSQRIWEETLGPDHPRVATSLNGLGLLYERMGEYARAEPLYRRSLKIREEKLGKDHPDLAVGLGNLAQLQAAQDHWQDAGDACEQARQILHRHVQRVLPGLSEGEQIDFLKTNYERGLHASLSLALAHGKDDASLRDRSAAWLCNGKALGQQSLADKALTARDSSGPGAADARRLLEVRRQLAALSLTLPAGGQERQRRQHLQGLVQQEQMLAKRLGQLRGQDQLDRPWLTLEQLRQAIADDAVFVDIARFAIHDFKATKKQRRWRPAHYAAWIIPPAGKGEVQLVDLGEARAIEEKVQAVRQALQQAPARIPEQGEPDSEKEMHRSLAALAGLVLQPLEAHIGKHKQWLISPDGVLWLVPWAALPLADGSYAVEKHSLRYLVSGRDLVQTSGRNRERPGAAQLFADPDFDLAPAQAAASHRGLADLAPELSGQTLKGVIGDWGVTFQLRSDGRLFIRDSHSSELVGQGSWEQQGSRLQMQTKICRFQGQIQGQRVSGTRQKQEKDGSASSARWTATLPAETGAPESERGLWIVPALSLPVVSALPGTAREAALVAPGLEKLTQGKPVVHTGAQASEGLLKAVQRPPMLMVSTHGFFLPDQETQHNEHPELTGEEGRATATLDHKGQRLTNPLLRCGLLLAGCNQRQKAAPGEEDGVLTGLEIVGLDLRGTELVVLSACETGVGQVRNGEGVAGLRQAFQLAGAQSVLATLWQIPDRETAQLMGRFFEELAQGKDRAEALRQAQLKLIEARRKRQDAAHPFFWAAFTLTGQ